MLIGNEIRCLRVDGFYGRVGWGHKCDFLMNINFRLSFFVRTWGWSLCFCACDGDLILISRERRLSEYGPTCKGQQY